MNEAQNRPNNSGDNITFDYNQLYANNTQINTTPPEAIPEINASPVMQETPIIFEEEKNNQQNVVTNVIPTFDSRALVEEDDNVLNHQDTLINSMKSETQQENEQYKKNIGFLLAFFGVLIFAVLFLFPLLAGY